MKVVHFPYTARNPYQTLLVGSLKELGIQVDVERNHLLRFLNITIVYILLKNWKPDVLHLHWQHSSLTAKSRARTIVKASAFILQILFAKLFRIKFAWTVHNLVSHDTRHEKIELFFSKLLARLADGIIAHCETAQKEIIKAYNIHSKDKVFILSHGNYIGAYPNKISRKKARQILDLSEEAFTFLLFGELRPYKGIENLIEAFIRLNKVRREQKKLIIVGRPENYSFEEKMRTWIANSNNILLKPISLSGNQIQIYFNAADVVVCPYKDILTSGAIFLALSFGKPIIAPKIGCIQDTLDTSGSFLYDPWKSDGLYDSMMTAIRQKSSIPTMSEHNIKLAENSNWSEIGKTTYKVYRFLLGKRKVSTISHL